MCERYRKKGIHRRINNPGMQVSRAQRNFNGYHPKHEEDVSSEYEVEFEEEDEVFKTYKVKKKNSIDPPYTVQMIRDENLMPCTPSSCKGTILSFF